MAAQEIKHGWFVPNYHTGFSYYKTPHGETVKVTHVGAEKSSYDDHPNIASHYVGEITEYTGQGAKSPLKGFMQSPL